MSAPWRVPCACSELYLGHAAVQIAQMMRYRGGPGLQSGLSALLDGLAATGHLPVGAEPLPVGPAVYVCCHARRDKRCGVCGPALMERFSSDFQACLRLSQRAASSCAAASGAPSSAVISGSARLLV